MKEFIAARVPMSPERRYRHRIIYALVGKLTKAGLPGDQIKEDGALQVSGGRTDRSSLLTDNQHRLLLVHLRSACERAGLEDPSEGRPKRQRRRTPPGAIGMRSADQVRAIRELALRLDYSEDAIADLVRSVPTAAKARASIEALKSLVVRNHKLIERAKSVLADDAQRARLAPRERGLLLDITATAGKGGRSVNRLRIGGVCWAFDVLERFGHE